METDAAGVSFPVVFFDGSRETDIGHIVIYASLSFKSFQSVLSQRIGISPHQISVYLADRKRSRSSPRKIPITSKVDFSAFLNEKDCFFFAVLKRSRRERRRRGQKEFSPGYEYGVDRSKKPPANVMLLRRNAGIDGDRPFSVLLPLVEYESQVRRLELERERYLLTMGFSDLRLDREDAAAAAACHVGNRGGVSGGLVVCEECLRAEKMGRDVGFHWCVYDAVTVGFRSPAGPIARPVKGSG